MNNEATPFAPKDLNRAGALVLQRIKNTLAKKGNFEPAIKVVLAGDAIVDVPFPAGWLNSDRHKDILFGLVRSFARETSAKGVVIVTDGFAVEYSNEEKRRIAEDREYGARYDEVARSAGSIDEVVAAGFGRKVESILITVQSPLFGILIQQHYERLGADGTHIVFLEEMTVDTAVGRLAGRLAIWGDEEERRPV
jgi:hypothetical protein